MSKKLPIPPIRPNPRRGKETATDASVVWGGAQPPKKSESPPERSTPARSRSKRKTPQQKFRVPNPEGLTWLSKDIGINKTAVFSYLVEKELKERGYYK